MVVGSRSGVSIGDGMGKAGGTRNGTDHFMVAKEGNDKARSPDVARPVWELARTC